MFGRVGSTFQRFLEFGLVYKTSACCDHLHEKGYLEHTTERLVLPRAVGVYESVGGTLVEYN